MASPHAQAFFANATPRIDTEPLWHIEVARGSRTRIGHSEKMKRLPRNVRINGTHFFSTLTGAPIVLSGPNIIVKGPPYLPGAEEDGKMCEEVIEDECAVSGTCTSCRTFTAADVRHIQSNGMNAIRLSVMWAGAQPRDEPALDGEFLRRLHALLALCDAHGLHVLLDNHGDMTGPAGCGCGIPMWLQQQAAPELIGRPLEPAFPFYLASCKLDVAEVAGYEQCGSNTSRWAAHAGDPDYPLLNECCRAININHGNPGALAFTTVSQRTLDHVLAGPGREAFVRFWQLMAQAVAEHPSAVAVELMNEPLWLWRQSAFDTWRAAAEAVHAIVPDMSVRCGTSWRLERSILPVLSPLGCPLRPSRAHSLPLTHSGSSIEPRLRSLCDIGNAPAPLSLPLWALRIVGASTGLSRSTVDWIRSSNYLFYAWHEAPQRHAEGNLARAHLISEAWHVPTFCTELYTCEQWSACRAAGISHSYWLYKSYCDTSDDFARTRAEQGGGPTFGGCMLGWGGSYPSIRASVLDPCMREANKPDHLAAPPPAPTHPPWRVSPCALRLAVLPVAASALLLLILCVCRPCKSCARRGSARWLQLCRLCRAGATRSQWSQRSSGAEAHRRPLRVRHHHHVRWTELPSARSQHSTLAVEE